MPIQTAVDETTALKAKEIKFQLPTLNVAVVGKWIWVSGETFPARSTLVAMGLRYSKDKIKWYWKPAGRSFKGRPRAYGQIISRYGEMRVEPIARIGA
jgi:hypothetical protein